MTSDFQTDALDALYRGRILDHAEHPRNQAPVDRADLVAEGMNPFCGDAATLRVRLGEDGRVSQVSLRTEGCTVARASASMLSELVTGGTLEDALSLSGSFHALMQGRDLPPGDLARLGDAAALRGVLLFPIRVKCALLAWDALEEAVGRRRKQGR